jgi:hypothetical protein
MSFIRSSKFAPLANCNVYAGGLREGTVHSGQRLHIRFSFSTASLTAAADVKVLGQVDLSKRNHSGAPHLLLTWRYQGTSYRWILLPLAEPVPTKAWS